VVFGLLPTYSRPSFDLHRGQIDEEAGDARPPVRKKAKEVRRVIRKTAHHLAAAGIVPLAGC
jgi:hypothetical protein